MFNIIKFNKKLDLLFSPYLFDKKFHQHLNDKKYHQNLFDKNCHQNFFGTKFFQNLLFIIFLIKNIKSKIIFY